MRIGLPNVGAEESLLSKAVSGILGIEWELGQITQEPDDGVLQLLDLPSDIIAKRQGGGWNSSQTESSTLRIVVAAS